VSSRFSSQCNAHLFLALLPEAPELILFSHILSNRRIRSINTGASGLGSGHSGTARLCEVGASAHHCCPGTMGSPIPGSREHGIGRRVPTRLTEIN
jgi:hypothetical protein